SHSRRRTGPDGRRRGRRRRRSRRAGPRPPARPGHPRHRHAPADRPPGGPRARPRGAGDTDTHPDHVRQRAVLLRGTRGRRVRIRAQVRRRPRPRRGVPGHHAGRPVPLPGPGRRPHPQLPGPDRDLVEACRATMRGEPFLYPGAVNALIRNYLDLTRDSGHVPAKAITDREEEILKLVAEGHTSQQIADLLTISPKTVERHRANLLSKLGLKDRLELTRYAIRVGLIEP